MNLCSPYLQNGVEVPNFFRLKMEKVRLKIAPAVDTTTSCPGSRASIRLILVVLGWSESPGSMFERCPHRKTGFRITSINILKTGN
jgi:hypothetical protein